MLRSFVVLLTIGLAFFFIFLLSPQWTSYFQPQLSSNVLQLPSPRSRCGEGPHWDNESQSLYYIDIEGPEATLLRYDYRENRTYAATVDNEPLMTFVLPVHNTSDEFLIGGKHAAKVIRWDGKSSKGVVLRTVFEVETNSFYDTNRFNDAKTDPFGRFYGGTQRLNGCDGPNTLANASFYSYSPTSGVKQLLTDIYISNGLTWNRKTNKFYYIDSCSYDIKEFQYDSATGDLLYQRTAFEFVRPEMSGEEKVLDGMTSDVDGNLFIATWGGHHVYKVDPVSGNILNKYLVPAKQVTSVAFGGPNLDILFVTTAARGEGHPPTAGHLYQITGLNTKGFAGVKVIV